MDVMLYGPWMEVVDNVWSDQLLSLNGSTVERKEEDEERARTMTVAMSMVVVHPNKPMQHAIEFGGPNMTSENEAGRDKKGLPTEEVQELVGNDTNKIPFFFKKKKELVTTEVAWQPRWSQGVVLG